MYRYLVTTSIAITPGAWTRCIVLLAAVFVAPVGCITDGGGETSDAEDTEDGPADTGTTQDEPPAEVEAATSTSGADDVPTETTGECKPRREPCDDQNDEPRDPR